MIKTKRSITELARELRRNPTEAEKRLWKILRRKQLNGFKFLCQKPLIYEEKYKVKSFFIADFYCSRLKLVIEVDGKIHDRQKQYDQERDKVIAELGLQVYRIKNKEVENLDQVREKILKKN
ncbi:MAG: DUF559 domain-containing protein [Bacteroidetes bacterium]|jgi:very-short-patch-repair endonuclease|nr:DUF559 domain-containing protein [Bacteroidota bacterium]